MVERFNEMASLAAVTAVVQTLGDLVKEQSGKRYARSADTRRERWLQLASLAESQAGRTVEPARKAARKPRVAPPAADTSVPITQASA